ncbi:MAG: hypothetical protein ABI589_14080 [Burkholderiales bacterium]
MLHVRFATLALVFTLLATAATAATGAGAGANELSVSLPSHDSLVLDLPDGWSARVIRPNPDLPPTVAFSGRDSRAFQMRVTPIMPKDESNRLTPETQRGMLEAMAEMLAAKSGETNVAPVQELSAPGRSGYYFSSVDPKPEANGYKYLTQGLMSLGGLNINFLVFAKENPQEAEQRGLEIMRSAWRAAAK